MVCSHDYRCPDSIIDATGLSVVPELTGARQTNTSTDLSLLYIPPSTHGGARRKMFGSAEPTVLLGFGACLTTDSAAHVIRLTRWRTFRSRRRTERGGLSISRVEQIWGFRSSQTQDACCYPTLLPKPQGPQYAEIDLFPPSPRTPGRRGDLCRLYAKQCNVELTPSTFLTKNARTCRGLYDF
ncbi:hypothetical protein BC826DRAFT_519256 [Russula brevipes]|nr:hypothetical protein BC826DRAFT_519256 [Russula brevipes]